MNVLELAIRSTLTGGTALTALLAGTASVYNAAVPRGVSFPCVVVNLQGGGDANETPRRRKDLLYQAKAISTASMTAAGAIDNEVDSLLHNKTLTVTGWTNFWLARERDIRYVEVDPEGVEYYHSGGIYRIRLCQ